MFTVYMIVPSILGFLRDKQNENVGRDSVLSLLETFLIYLKFYGEKLLFVSTGLHRDKLKLARVCPYILRDMLVILSPLNNPTYIFNDITFYYPSV
jgi:hypothetical protein